jgi:uncharacterized protein (TIGR02217 family)
MAVAFHEVLFPIEISLGSHGGPERRTEVVITGSGAEQRNSRWSGSRRRFNAGYGVASLEDLHRVLVFFEERRGRLYGFRWRDPLDFKSSSPGRAITALDQEIGTGSGTRATFQLSKAYGRDFAPWVRTIHKPVAGSVLVAVDGALVSLGTTYAVDTVTGMVRFLAPHIPAAGAKVSAGFEYHVPVRFDTDSLDVNLHGFKAGAIPNIPIVEIRP